MQDGSVMKSQDINEESQEGEARTNSPSHIKVEIGRDVINSVIVPGSGNTLNVNIHAQPPKDSPVLQSFLTAQLEAFSAEFSSDRSAELERVQELYREGRRAEARLGLLEMRERESWKTLPESLRAKVLRTLARYELDLNSDAGSARGLIEEARKLDPTGDDIVERVLLLSREDGIEAALAELQEPRDTKAFNLMISLLLQGGRIDEALAGLQNIRAGITPDAETRRFHALVLLAKGETEMACDLVGTLLAEKPQWEAVRVVAALVDYWSCLSPSVSFSRIVSWPAPAWPGCLKTDPDSLGRLRNAERQFALLASQTGGGDDQRKSFETWRLACLANDPERQEEAVAYCRELLDADPANHRALLWAVSFNFDVDFQRSEQALESQLGKELTEGERADVGSLIALLAVHLKLRNAPKALSLLSQSKDHFDEEGAGDYWTFWQAQALIADGQPEAALEIASQAADGKMRRQIETIAQRAIAIQANDYEPFVTFLERSYGETHDGFCLLELCELQFSRREWGYVVERSRELIDLLGTAQAVCLAAVALWNVKKYARCLEVLEQYQGHFQNQRLPDELWRMRVYCRLSTGKTLDAVKDAEELARQHRDTANLLTLFDAYFHKGDLTNLSVAARDLLKREDIRPPSAIQIARLLKPEHPELAKKFLLRAKEGIESTPEYFGALIGIGFELNLEDEVEPLLKQIHATVPSEATGVKVFTIEEFLEFWQKRADQRRQLIEDYERGKIPLHLFAKQHGETLAELLHGWAEMNRAAAVLSRQPIIFARHGSRQINRRLVNESKSWRLHLDITALILAEDLDILDQIEKCFGPLHIPSVIPPSLAVQLNELTRTQPSQLEQHEAILSLLDRGRMQVTTETGEVISEYGELAGKIGKDAIAQMLMAKAEGGFAVTYLPLPTLRKETVELPPELAGHVINSRAVLEGLKGKGLLSATQYETALRRLGTVGNSVESVTAPLPGATLYLCGNIAGVLAGAGLLEPICRHFRVVIDSSEAQSARYAVQGETRRGKLQQWLKRLIDRVQSGIDDGMYQTIAIPDERPDGAVEERELDNLGFDSVRHLLLYNPQPGDVIWADDRFFNHHLQREHGVPIIGISEVLKALRENGELSEDEYYERLLRLRAGNVRYIPIDSAEILYHLRQAQHSQEGNFAETHELSVLRRYLAACLLDERRLQVPPMPEGSHTPMGELNFLISVNNAVKDAIIEVWQENSLSVEAARARADWLLDNLYTGVFGTLHLLDRSEIQIEFSLPVGSDISDLLTKALYIDLQGKSAHRRPRRRAFLAWLYRRLVAPRRKSDPKAVEIASQHLQSMMARLVFHEFEQPEAELAVRFVSWQFFEDILEEFQGAIMPSPQIMERLGLQTVENIAVGNLNFPANVLLVAAEKAVTDGKAAVQASEYPDELTLTAVKTDNEAQMAFEFRNAAGELVMPPFVEPLWALALPDQVQREAVLCRYPELFDCDEATLKKEVQEIAALGDFAGRIKRAEVWRRESAEFFYRMLEGNFRGAGEFDWSSLMPPSADGLLRHYRLTQAAVSGQNFTDALLSSSLGLLREEGLESALERLACLPIRIPDPVVAELSQLPEAEKLELLRRCDARWASPVSKLQAIDLMIRSAHDNQEALQLARNSMLQLFDNEYGQWNFRLFRDCLNFVNDEFWYCDHAKGWSLQVKLAMVWAHACRLHNVFHRAGSVPDFKRRVGQVSAETLSGDLLYKNDVLHPERLHRTEFLVQGVAALLSNQDPQILKEVEVAEFIGNRMFKERGANEVEALQLLRDRACATNLTGSFLGGDRAKDPSPIFGEKEVELLSSEKLRDRVSEAVNNLVKDPAERVEWAWISTVVGDLPIYAQVSERFESLLGTLDLVSLHQANPMASYVALQAISGQLVYLKNEILKSRVEEAVLHIAALEAERERQGRAAEADHHLSNDQVDAMLWQIARGLALRPGDPRATGEAFGRLLQKLIYIWTPFRSEAANATMRMLTELPADQGWGLWRAFLALRASREEGL